MKVKRLSAVFMVSLLLMSVTGCGGKENINDNPEGSKTTSVSSAESKESKPNTGENDYTQGNSYNIRIASSSAAREFEGDGTTAMGVSCNYFVNRIKEVSGGRVTAQVFSGGQLASSTQEYIGGAQNGAFDIFILNCGSWADYTPAFAGLNIPYLYHDYDEVYAVLNSEVGEAWKKKAFEDTQCMPLAYFDIGFRELTCNSEVHSPDDLKGVKIRTMPDPIQMESWEAFGCTVTPVPYAELYSALQQKMVDAQENPPSNIYSSKVYELQKYMIMTNHNWTSTIAAAGPVFWDGLSDIDKQMIQEVMIEAQNEGRKHTEKFADEFVQKIDDSETTDVIKLTDDELKVFQEKAKSVWPKVEEQMGTDAYNQLLEFLNAYNAS